MSSKAQSYIPNAVLMAFENGDLSPMETLVLSKIAGFTRNGNPCYPSNRWIGEQFNMEKQEALTDHPPTRTENWARKGQTRPRRPRVQGGSIPESAAMAWALQEGIIRDGGR